MLWGGSYLPFEQRPTLSSAQREAWTLIIKSLDFTLASNVALIIAKSVSGHLKSHCGAIIMLLLSSVQIFFLRTCTEKSFQCSWISLIVTSCDPLARHHRTGPSFDPLVHINLTPVICLSCKWFIIMPAFYVHYGQNVNYKMGRCGPRFHVNPLTWRLRLWLTLHISASCLSVGEASCCIDSNKVGLGLIAI